MTGIGFGGSGVMHTIGWRLMELNMIFCGMVLN